MCVFRLPSLIIFYFDIYHMYMVSRLCAFWGDSSNYIYWECFWTLITRIWFLTWICSWCFFILPFSQRDLGHLLHGCGFSPVCIFRCFSKLPFSEKAFGYWLHGYGFLPECVLRFFFKLPFSQRDLLHSLHGLLSIENCFWLWLKGYGFSPECVLRCFLFYHFLKEM